MRSPGVLTSSIVLRLKRFAASTNFHPLNGALIMRKPALVLAAVFFCALPLAAQSNSAAKPEQHGIQTQNMDRSVKPGDNFYLYANGDWIKRTELPADRAGLGVFSIIDDRTNKFNAEIIGDAAKSNAPAGSDQRKIADLYHSYMDEAAIEARGMAPIKPLLDAVAAIKDKRQLAKALGETLRSDVDALNNTNFHTSNIFGLWVAPGFSDSDHYAAYILEGGLTLPNRDYYVTDDAHMKTLREKFQQHVANMFKLAGYSEPDARAAHVMDIEMAIAKVHTSLADDEDIKKANNPWTKADFAKNAPGLDWNEYFAAAGLGKENNFIVWQPGGFTGEAALVESAPLENWKDWLAFHKLEGYAGVLPKAFADERFDFFGKTLSGVSQQRPRERRAISVVNGELGDAVGQIYAQRYFPPEAKKQAQEMVANIIAAFRKRIDALDWMAPETKAEAQAKLTTLYVGVGYPETWKDYSALEIKADDLFGNVRRGGLWDYHREIARLGKPVDKHEWSMEPQTVNAVNLPLQNALNFPAAILQAPFFDAKAPAVTNYGAIGSVIGHEISHTFDTEGSAFDSKGRVRDWWTPSDLKHFEATTARLAAQYDSYAPFPDLHVNGKQTLAENIADNGGLAASYDGYRASYGGKEAPEVDGFTGDQQFYIAFAQNWGSKTRDQSLRSQVMGDPHSPSEYRAYQVRNMDAWYKAFDVKPGDKLYLAPDERVHVW
jgi:putative endopeptidase